MQVVENKSTIGENIMIDDRHFINCRYKNCKLIYSGGDFAYTDTAFENCQVVLSGPAQKTASFLGAVGILKPPTPPPVSGPDKPVVQ